MVIYTDGMRCEGVNFTDFVHATSHIAFLSMTQLLSMTQTSGTKLSIYALKKLWTRLLILTSTLKGMK